MTTTITDEQLEALAQEAGQAGDAAQVRLCQQALAGDERAKRACVAAIREQEAQR